MKKVVLIICLFLGNVYSFAQVTQQWVARYNGPGNTYDYATSIAVDDSGNVYVTGTSYGDCCTIKYNSSGDTLWVARYNEPGHHWDYANSIAVDNSGNVYVTGTSSGFTTNDDYCTIKYDPNGDSLWVARYNGPGNHRDYANSIAVDNSGNVYVTGYSRGTYSVYATIKYNSAGVQQWVKIYSGPVNGQNIATSIAVDSLGNVYVTGGSYGSYGSGINYATIKYNLSGDTLWVARYNGAENGFDIAYSLAVDNSGNVYVTGQSVGSGTFYDYATIKYNSAGVQQWVERYNGPGNWDDRAYSLAVDISGNVYVTGYSYGNGNYEDYATIKYNSSGDTLWVARYNGPGNAEDRANSLAVDNSGNVYVTGSSYGSGTSLDYCTIKYYDPIGIQPISTKVPDQYILYQNYPNPFNPTTKIKFEIPRSGDVKLVVYDILGREIAILVNELLKPGVYEVEWNASNMPSGVYFYKITIADFTETKKMVLIK